MHLREARAILGLSLEGAANRMGVSSRTVFRWEHGELEGAPVKPRSQLQERVIDEFKRAAEEAQAPSAGKLAVFSQLKKMEEATGLSVYEIVRLHGESVDAILRKVDRASEERYTALYRAFGQIDMILHFWGVSKAALCQEYHTAAWSPGYNTLYAMLVSNTNS